MLTLGKLEFWLSGERLSGKWLLVRSSRDGRGRSPAQRGKEEWLLSKFEDGHARPLDKGDVLEERPESVASSLTVRELAERLARVWESWGRPRLRNEIGALSGAREPLCLPSSNRSSPC